MSPNPCPPPSSPQEARARDPGKVIVSQGSGETITSRHWEVPTGPRRDPGMVRVCPPAGLRQKGEDGPLGLKGICSGTEPGGDPG